MSTLQQLGSNVQRNLNDQSANFFDLANDVYESVQTGYQLVASLTESIENNATINFQSGLVYYDFSQYIPDYLRIFGIYNNNINRWMYPTSLLELYRIRDNWEMGSGDPYWFLPIDYKTVALFPVQALGVGSMTVLYKAKADTLTIGASPQLPEEHHNVLEFDATGELLEQAQEWTKAITWAGMADQSIDKIRKVIRERTSPNHLYFKQA